MEVGKLPSIPKKEINFAYTIRGFNCADIRRAGGHCVLWTKCLLGSSDCAQLRSGWRHCSSPAHASHGCRTAVAHAFDVGAATNRSTSRG